MVGRYFVTYYVIDVIRKIIKTIEVTDKYCSIYDPAQICFKWNKKYVSVSQKPFKRNKQEKNP